jgi:hypothetical protein
VILRASELENYLSCPAYLFNTNNGLGRFYSSYTKRAFEDGVAHEDRILTYAEQELNFKILETQKQGSIEVSGITITGHADAIAEKDDEIFVIEAKFLRARSIYAILNEPVNFRYHLQVQAYLHIFEIDKGLLIMRNKDTPIFKEYQHFTREIEKNSEFFFAAIDAIKEITEPSGPKDDSLWLCSPVWCPYHYACDFKVDKQEEEELDLKELEELVELYKELNEEYAGFEAQRRALRDEIIKFLENKNLNRLQLKDSMIELKTQFRRSLKKDLKLPDEFFELTPVKVLKIY